MDLVLQLHLLIPQLAQLLWQVLDQEPVDEDVDEDGGEGGDDRDSDDMVSCFSFINNKETTTRSQSIKILYKIFCIYLLLDLVTAAELESSPRAF